MDHASPARGAVEDRLFAALGVVRVVVLLNAVGLNVYRHASFERPVAAVACVALMAAWTVVVTLLYRHRERRTPALLTVDLLLAVAMMLATPWVKDEAFRATLPGFWIIGALMAWAVRWGWRGGLAAGTVLAVTDLVLREHVRQSDYGHAFLLVVGGTVFGYMCGALQQMATERERAERAAGEAAERARLARAAHDGVLQVLALVQRRGRELGGEVEELGRLAGEQEQGLRRLIRAQEAVDHDDGPVDVAARLAGLEQRPGVTVAAPGFPVRLPAPVAEELVAAVAACLDNVDRHVGEGAPAWVLLQERPDMVVVSVRDDGPGIPEGRLEAAVAQGRLGVSGSIRGRVEQLGGTAEVTSGPHGTEWRLTVPRPTAG